MKNTKEYNESIGKAMFDLEEFITETKGLSITISYLRSKHLWSVRFVNQFVWLSLEDREEKNYKNLIGLSFENEQLLDALNNAFEEIKSNRQFLKKHKLHTEYKYLGQEYKQNN